MARRRKPSPIVLLLLGAMIVFGLALVGMTVLEIPISDIFSLTIIQRLTGCDPDEVECFLGFQGFFNDGNPPRFALPLSEVDTNAPITINFVVDPIRTGSFALPLECEPFVTEDVIVNMKDGNGNIIQVIQEGLTDLQPLLLPNQQTLVLEFVAGVCQPNFDDGIRSINYAVSGVPDPSVGGNPFPSLRFLQKPPEIREFSNALLEQRIFLSDNRDQAVDELVPRFAIAETFQLVNPTVITDLTFQMAILRPDDRSIPIDLQTTITAYVWNMGQTPPERIVQSSETFTGLDRDHILQFTFPNAVALLPVDNNDQPITYGVGVRIDQNPTQKFGYQQSNQTAATHLCVIDRNSQVDSENMFVPNGLCGFDIFHSQFLASTILDEVDIDTPIIDLDPLSREELITLLCEGVSPEPEICQGDIFILNANSCGVTEVFFDESCICAPNYDRNEAGKCELRETPDLLKIGDFTSEELVIIGLGLLILVIGAVGIAALTRR